MLIVAAAGLGIGVWQGGVVSSGGGAVANLWVDTNGGTCTRAVADTYANLDSKSCSSIVAAYNQANSNDLVLVKCGTYSASQTFTTNKSSAPNVVIQSETPLCATTGDFFFDSGGDYVTLKDFTMIKSGGVIDQESQSRVSTGVVLDGNNINVGQIGNFAAIYIKWTHDWTIKNNTIGPMCCGVSNSPEGIRVAQGTIGQPSNNLTIDHNLIQYVIRDCSYWPSSGFGSCPEATCPDFNACHVDGMHIYGLTNSTISRNTLYGDDCQGIFLEGGGSLGAPGSITSGITITNNAIGPLAESCGNKAIYLPMSSDQFSGTFNIAFNSADGPVNVGGFSACSSCTINLTGNYAPLYVHDNGGSPECTDAGATFNYTYNVWLTVGGGTNTACGGNDVLLGSPSPAFANSAIAPGVGIDMHLTGSAGTADQFVPSGTCTPVAPTDFDLQTRPIGASCDAGADER